MNKLTDTVKHILIINVLFFIVKVVLRQRGIDLDVYLALFFPKSIMHYPWQYLSHMFMHADVNHLLFNMLVLYFFGSTVEILLGTKRFILFYLFCGLGAAFLHLGVNYLQYMNLVDALPLESDLNMVINDGAKLYFEEGKNWTDSRLGNLNSFLLSPMLGASGAMFGLYAAAAMLFGEQKIHLYFLFPIKIKYFVAGLIVYELYRGVTGTGGNVANFAHLGGALFAFIMITYWKIDGINKNRWN
ncbi:MAG: rhomboid family intramembrane serine protease [Kordia sp.]|nr:MAG: rhomboid family intramembrane serine protease [Kordia sp.]